MKKEQYSNIMLAYGDDENWDEREWSSTVSIEGQTENHKVCRPAL